MRTLAGLALAAAVLAPAAASEAAGFGCSSSAARISVLGQQVEPLRVNPSGVGCATETRTLAGPATALPASVGASALVAATQVYEQQRSVLASAGAADLTIASLPALPISLPPVAVPDAAKAAIAAARTRSIDLAPVKTLIPVRPTDLVTNLITTLTADLPTDLPTTLTAGLLTSLPVSIGDTFSLPMLPTALRADLPTNLPTGFVSDPADPALDTPAEVAAANSANVAANSANAAANLADAAANAASEAANVARAALNAFGTITTLNLVQATAAAANVVLQDGLARTKLLAAEAAGAAANAANAAANLSNAAINASHAATNAANALANAANAATNAVRAAIPDTVGVDGAAGLDGLLAGLLPSSALPALDLLSVKGAMAYAAGTCQSGEPRVSGSSSVTGIRVLGQDVPTGQLVDRVTELIGAASIDPSDVALPTIDLGLTQAQRDLIESVPVASTALGAATQAARDAIRSALDALSVVGVRDPTSARVVVTPGAQVRTATGVVQQALKATVTIAGQPLVDAVVGEARASAAGVDCSAPLVDPAGRGGTDPSAGGQGVVSVPGFRAPLDTSTPAGAVLQCSRRRLVLVDVLERAGRVRLYGVGDPALAGRTVAIVFGATGRVVARARVAGDGTFDTTAPLPPASLRGSNAARYTARLGPERSLDLKLRRRMTIESMTAQGRRVTITGRVLAPLARPLRSITLTRRVSCTEEKVVRRFRPAADGRFRITVTAPSGLGTAVYRMTTKVRYSVRGSALSETYTLPRAVALG